MNSSFDPFPLTSFGSQGHWSEIAGVMAHTRDWSECLLDTAADRIIGVALPGVVICDDTGRGCAFAGDLSRAANTLKMRTVPIWPYDGDIYFMYEEVRVETRTSSSIDFKHAMKTHRLAIVTNCNLDHILSFPAPPRRLNHEPRKITSMFERYVAKLGACITICGHDGNYLQVGGAPDLRDKLTEEFRRVLTTELRPFLNGRQAVWSEEDDSVVVIP